MLCLLKLSSVAHIIITVLRKAKIVKIILMHVACVFITITSNKCTINIQKR